MKIIPALILIIHILGACPVKAQSYSFTFQNMVRDYIVHLPSGYDPAVKYPLVLNLHGYGSYALQQRAYSRMDDVADTAKFIVVYPNGVSNAWNVGWWGAYNGGIDDVGFLSALIDTVSKKYTVDAQRVYSCGMSNGGFMSYRLACELNKKIAAIASVTGSMSDSTLFYCTSPRPVPVLEIHGTADNTVPFNGSQGMIAIDEVIDYWKRKNETTTSVITPLPDIYTADNSTATRYHYGNGYEGAEVVLLKIQNGGHSWPGAVPVSSLGNTNQDINASGEIWSFFMRHALPAAQSIATHDDGPACTAYPNPFTSVFTVSGDDIQKVELTDITGNRIDIVSICKNGRDHSIDAGELSKGVYIVRLQTSAGVITKRMIKAE